MALCPRQTIQFRTGIGLLYSELVQGIPPIFRRFVEKIPSIHSIFIFVSVKHLPVSKVEPRERFLFRQFEPRDLKMFKCVVRYGYKDAVEAGKDFEKKLIEHLKEFIHHEFFIRDGSSSPLQNHSSEESAIEGSTPINTDETLIKSRGSATINVDETLKSRRTTTISIDETLKSPGSATIPVDETIKSQGPATIKNVDETLKSRGSARHSSGSIHPAANSSRERIGTPIPAIEEEKQFIQREMEKGVVYLLGETEMVAKPDSSIIKRVVVNNIYHFIRLNFRQGDEAMAIPKARLLKVGVTYEI